MMPEIALNILDVAQNAVAANATLIEILVSIYTDKDILVVEINDDGCGMTKEQVENVIDPFFTTRTTRKVGLGIPFFKLAAESAGGSFAITSEKGKGTKVKAIFKLSHIDRMPLGDINANIHALITFNEGINFYYKYTVDEAFFVLDTREIREIVGEVSFTNVEIADFLKEFLENNKNEVDRGITI